MLIRAFFLLLLMSCNISYAALFGDDEARQQIQVLRKQVSEMEARIAKMEQALNSQALLELYAQVETLGLELGKLNGQIEMLSNDNTLLQKRQRDFYIDLDNRLREIEQSTNKRAPSSTPPKSSPHSMAAPPSTELAAAPPAAVTTPETEETVVAAVQSDAGSVLASTLVPPGPEENSVYKEAFSFFKNGDYVSAIGRFESFLENYPQSNLAPGAAYWIGNARYALRDYQMAIDAQRKLINKYPDSLKTSDALLNIASSQYEMGDSKASKHTLEDLVAKYPLSEAAKKAKQRLANVK
ncbi:MAG: tol-pal system protein YbgF [Nitrosomonas sp.]|nr:tol-pal system protein YbgF [Nitrosomonas sp.]MBP6075075.1 tol-pal system protein YbgF [Nitrosomonas sp.]